MARSKGCPAPIKAPKNIAKTTRIRFDQETRQRPCRSSEEMQERVYLFLQSDVSFKFVEVMATGDSSGFHNKKI